MNAKLLSIKEAIQLLSVSRPTFWRLRKLDKTFPKPVIVLDTKKFVYSEIVEWVESKKANR